MPTLRFWVEGKPEPQGSKTAGNRKDGSAFLRDKNPRDLKAWRKSVTQGILTQMGVPDGIPVGYNDILGDVPITAPVILRMTFWLPRPKDRPKTLDVLPTVRPDVDKLARAVMDSLTASKLIKDDSIVYDMHPIKRYAIDPVTLPKIFTDGFHRPVPGVEILLSWVSR